MRYAPTLLTLLLLPTALAAQQDGDHGHGHGPDAAHAHDLGVVGFENSAAAAAQEPLQRGVALLHSFEYGRAAEAFRVAQAVDPGFALAYWLEAFTNTHPLWGEDDVPAARAVLTRLGASADQRLARAATPRERAYGAAVETFYADGSPAERARRFADAMRGLAGAWPEDEDAVAFAALGPMMVEVMARASGEERVALRDEAIGYARRVFEAHPRHPGGTHYLIHATDDPAFAARGLAAARSYAATAPSSEHAQHMPSHIFLQLGLWSDVIASNERAWAAGRAEIAARGLSNTQLSWHALQWLQYGYLQEGRVNDARALIDLARELLAGVDVTGPQGVDARHAVGWMEFTQAANTGSWTPSQCERSRDFRFDGEPVNPRDRSMRAVAAYQAVVTGAFCGHAENPAAAVARAHLEGDPDSPYAAALRAALAHADAITALRSGDPATAVAVLEPLAALPASAPIGPPGALRTNELLGEALLAAGRPAEAIAAWERSLELTPNRRASVLGLERARAAL